MKRCGGIFRVFLIALIFLMLPFIIQGEDLLVFPGVRVEGMELGGKNQAEVFKVFESIDEKVGKRSINFVIDDVSGDLPGKITTTYQEIGIVLDKDKMWQDAVAVGRDGNWWTNILMKWQAKRKGYVISLRLYIDEERAEKFLREKTKPWYREAKDAALQTTEDDKVMIIPHEYGRGVDWDAAMRYLQEEISYRPGLPLGVTLHLTSIEPKRLTEDVEKYQITELLSGFTTVFNQNEKNRTQNIRIAANSIDGCLIEPGGIFSFNEVVGPRTEEAGYSDAKIFVQNEVVPGIGGGVCQVSSTVYIAALKAEQEIVERYPHSKTVSYATPGLDATVVYGYRDVKFRNNTEGHLLIKCHVEKNRLMVKIYGKEKKREGTVEIKSRRVSEIQPDTIFLEDPDVPQGEYILARQGEAGLIVVVERFYYDKSGSLIMKEFISRDSYPAVARIIKVREGG